MSEKFVIGRFWEDPKPKIVFIDGCDYAGKTTLIDSIFDSKLENYDLVKRLSFPSQELRAKIKKEYDNDYHATPSWLYIEDIYNSLEKALNQGNKLIICDRSLFTNVVYQDGDFLESMWKALAIVMKLQTKANVYHLFMDRHLNDILLSFKKENKGEDSMDRLTLNNFKVEIQKVRKKYKRIVDILVKLEVPKIYTGSNIGSWYQLGIFP